MNIRTKLLFGYLLVATLVTAVLYIGFRANLTADQAFIEATEQSVPTEKALQNVRGAALRIAASTNRYLHLQGIAHGPGARAIAPMRSSINREKRRIEEAMRELERSLSRYSSMSIQAGRQDPAFVGDITHAGQVFQRESQALLDFSSQGAQYQQLPERQKAFDAAEERLIRLIDSALAFEELHMSSIVATSSEKLQQVRRHFAALAIFLLIGVLGTMVAVTVYISRPLQKLIHRSQRIESQEEGADSTSTVLATAKRRDEIRELDAALDAMETRLEDSRARLRQHQDTLEHRIDERTAELKAALDRAEDLAREARSANAAKAAFLANMSHEIRTPLNGVMGTAELLWHSNLDGNQRSLVDTINRSGNNLMRIINDILDFSKIDAGRLELECVPFSPGNTLEEVVSLLSPGAQAKHLNLVADFDQEIYAEVLGDSGRLRQVILNLVSNAIKFTHAGEVRLRASALHTTPTTCLLSIDVADTGIGMSAEICGRLFQPFSQADASTTRRFGGTGLGLAISRELIELMNGTISVRSTEGKGATFSIKIELRCDPNTSIQARESPSRSAEEGPEPRTHAPSEGSNPPSNLTLITDPNCRVLIAEDNPVNRMVATKMLQRLGIVPTAVENGKEALQAVMQSTYDLVFMDCHMPEMDGYEATERIRQFEQAQGRVRAPIIALTADALSGARERTLQAGMDDYASKPLSISTLRDVLQRWLVDVKEPV